MHRLCCSLLARHSPSRGPRGESTSSCGLPPASSEAAVLDSQLYGSVLFCARHLPLWRTVPALFSPPRPSSRRRYSEKGDRRGALLPFPGSSKNAAAERRRKRSREGYPRASPPAFPPNLISDGSPHTTPRPDFWPLGWGPIFLIGYLRRLQMGTLIMGSLFRFVVSRYFYRYVVRILLQTGVGVWNLGARGNVKLHIHFVIRNFILKRYAAW